MYQKGISLKCINPRALPLFLDPNTICLRNLFFSDYHTCCVKSVRVIEEPSLSGGHSSPSRPIALQLTLRFHFPAYFMRKIFVNKPSYALAFRSLFAGAARWCARGAGRPLTSPSGADLCTCPRPPRAGGAGPNIPFGPFILSIASRFGIFPHWNKARFGCSPAPLLSNCCSGSPSCLSILRSCPIRRGMKTLSSRKSLRIPAAIGGGFGTIGFAAIRIAAPGPRGRRDGMSWALYSACASGRSAATIFRIGAASSCCTRSTRTMRAALR